MKTLTFLAVLELLYLLTIKLAVFMFSALTIFFCSLFAWNFYKQSIDPPRRFAGR